MTYSADWKAAKKDYDAAYEAQQKELADIQASLVKDLAKAVKGGEFGKIVDRIKKAQKSSASIVTVVRKSSGMTPALTLMEAALDKAETLIAAKADPQGKSVTTVLGILAKAEKDFNAAFRDLKAQMTATTKETKVMEVAVMNAKDEFVKDSKGNKIYGTRVTQFDKIAFKNDPARELLVKVDEIAKKAMVRLNKVSGYSTGTKMHVDEDEKKADEDKAKKKA